VKKGKGKKKRTSRCRIAISVSQPRSRYLGKGGGKKEGKAMRSKCRDWQGFPAPHSAAPREKGRKKEGIKRRGGPVIRPPGNRSPISTEEKKKGGKKKEKQERSNAVLNIRYRGEEKGGRRTRPYAIPRKKAERGREERKRKEGAASFRP